MFDGTSLLVIPLLSGVEGADIFNFYFSLVSACGLIGLVPAAIARLLKETSR